MPSDQKKFFRTLEHPVDWLRGKWVFVADGAFGDNGKGKVTNFLCHYLKELGLEVGLCVRPNGGANAGHEVLNPFGRGDREGSYVGHITPMGVLQGVPSLIGPGTVFDPEHFFRIELPRLRERGVDTEKILISPRAQIVLPHYRRIEDAEENLRGRSAIGTTKKAIGTAYEYRAKRAGICVGDVIGDRHSLWEKIVLSVRLARQVLPIGDTAGLEAVVFKHLWKYRERLNEMTADEQAMYRRLREQGHVGVAEMGQGTFLDNIHGEHPFVTSSGTTIPAGLWQAGLSPRDLGYSILVVKGPYWTRVGNGPFATEFDDKKAEEFRQTGREFGTTTGRPRRCGAPDLPLLARAIELNGADCLCLTKMDKTADKKNLTILSTKRSFEEWDGWGEKEAFGAREISALPWQARQFIDFLETELGHLNTSLINLVSTGPSLEDMIVTDDFLKKPQ
jgi:adenylosuccinate synthase